MVYLVQHNTCRAVPRLANCRNVDSGRSVEEKEQCYYFAAIITRHIILRGAIPGSKQNARWAQKWLIPLWWCRFWFWLLGYPVLATAVLCVYRYYGVRGCGLSRGLWCRLRTAQQRAAVATTQRQRQSQDRIANCSFYPGGSTYVRAVSTYNTGRQAVCAVVYTSYVRNVCTMICMLVCTWYVVRTLSKCVVCIYQVYVMKYLAYIYK